QLYQRLDSERSRVRQAAQTMDATKHRARMQILQHTDILCCTLSGSGHEMMTSLGCTFDTVIIDEAAQSIELACLIPLKYGCERCILVGDPNQLPPTVLSLAAAKLLYNQSMFVRIQRSAPDAVSLLSIQYRMHPEISAFPSRLFYASRLRDGPDMQVKQAAPWHSGGKFPPFAFFDIAAGREEAGRSHSVFNMAEVDAATQLVLALCTTHSDLRWRQRIGIITPYKQQLRKLVERFRQVFGDKVTDAIEFNTVDGFQGQEKDVVIFSCVRAGADSVGFLADERRMNVGLTRARKSLFVLGNASMLTVSPLWKQLVQEAKTRGLLREARLPLFGRRAMPGTQVPALFQVEDTAAAQADGEGNRAEFTLEAVDDAALARLNSAIVTKDPVPTAVVSGGDRPPLSASEVAKEKRLLAKPLETAPRPKPQSSLFINRRKPAGRPGNSVRASSRESVAEDDNRRTNALQAVGQPPSLPGLRLVSESRASLSSAITQPWPVTPYPPPTPGPPPPPASANLPALPPPLPPVSANLPALPPPPLPHARPLQSIQRRDEVQGEIGAEVQDRIAADQIKTEIGTKTTTDSAAEALGETKAEIEAEIGAEIGAETGAEIVAEAAAEAKTLATAQ
ncbi:DEAD-box type RNA helicase, partial [Coemansia sp. RSA 2703]